MRIVCDECSTKYSLPDETFAKYEPGIQFTCKKCGHLVLVENPKANLDGVPAIFDRVAFPTAQETASQGGTWLLVDTTAAWCAPCRAMDRSTWRHPGVIEWVRTAGS